jgi:hypothetical protein
MASWASPREHEREGRKRAARLGRPKTNRERAGESRLAWRRPSGHQAAKVKRVSYPFHFFFYLYSCKTLFKMDFESKSKEIKTTPQNKTNATA